MFIYKFILYFLLYPKESFTSYFKTAWKKRFFNGATSNWFLYATKSGTFRRFPKVLGQNASVNTVRRAMVYDVHKLTSKYGQRIVLILLYPLYKAQSLSESSFSRIFIAVFPISFVNNATNFFICPLDRWIKAAFVLLVFFIWVPFLFLVYANIPFKCF